MQDEVKEEKFVLTYLIDGRKVEQNPVMDRENGPRNHQLLVEQEADFLIVDYHGAKGELRTTKCKL